MNYKIEDIPSLGALIAKKRKELAVTQSELANDTGIVRHHISNFEKGKQNISVKTLFALLNTLGLKLEIKEKNKK